MNRLRRVAVAANLDRLNSICLASEQAVEKVLQAPLAREVIAYSLKVVDEREPWCVLSVGKEGPYPRASPHAEKRNCKSSLFPLDLRPRHLLD